MANNLELFIGTYEEFLLSYKVKQKDDGTYFLHRFIAQKTHTNSIRCVDSNGRYLAAGGADDRIIILDMKKNHEVQMLTHHNGTINQVKFTPDGTYLFSAADDGTMAATKTGSWITDNIWRTPHNGKSITNICIHPTGKLALTLGRDLTIRTWNLIKGRQCFTNNLKKFQPYGNTIDNILFCPSGEFFSMTGTKTVFIMSVAATEIVKEISVKKQVTSACWIDDNTLLMGLETGQILIVNIEGDDELYFDAHTSRIKDVKFLNDYVVSISSSGDITMWKYEDNDLTQLCTTNIGCRPICVSLIDTEACDRKTVVADSAAEKEIVKKENLKIADDAKKIKTTGKVVIETNDDESSSMIGKLVTKNKLKKIEDKKQSENAAIKKAKSDDLKSAVKLKKKISQKTKPETKRTYDSDDANEDIFQTPKQKKKKTQSTELSPASIKSPQSSGKKPKRRHSADLSQASTMSATLSSGGKKEEKQKFRKDKKFRRSVA